MNTMPLRRPAHCPFDPPTEFARLRRDEPVSLVVTPAGAPAWLVTRHEDARLVLSDKRFTARGPVESRGVIDIDGPEHKRLRQLLIPELTIRRAEGWRLRVRKAAEERVAILESPADLVTDFARPVTGRVLGELVGLPEGFPVGLEAALLRPMLTDVVDQRRREPTTDLISGLLRQAAVMAEPPSTAEMVGLAMTVLHAGYETSIGMLTLSALVLMEDPRRVESLTEGEVAVSVAVEELLRYLTVVQQGLPRYATEDVRIGERVVRKGECVVVSISSANRDPAVFHHPDELRLVRPTSRAHLAFGYGAHQCLGSQLARVLVQEGLTALFSLHPQLRLAKPRTELVFTDRSPVHGLRSLPVMW
ncbi:cytochrome P450 [Kutzneria sp. 744]|uniref:cytochrome P450 n=1 Tax=Kutzneria sp. (strain 744) TaxID=345341 RepID=UPI0003EEBACC|nr:cytochrome P450 [Kutzneria sp. 744]EWM10893.1 cytochrome P450-SU2 [Kutzneria sp. 744]